MSLPGSTLGHDEVRAIYTAAVAKRQVPVRVTAGFEDGTVRACRLFEDAHGRIYATAKGFRSSGYAVDAPGYRLVRCELRDNAADAHKKKLTFARLLARRKHPALWKKFDGMDAEQLVLQFSCSNAYFVDLRRRLPGFVHEDLTRAVSTGEEFTWRKPGPHMSAAGRDISVQIRRSSEHGGSEAWFSSEFRGCGNGSYYLIISPDWAAHCEND